MRIAFRHRQDQLVVELEPDQHGFRVRVDGKELQVEPRWIADGVLLIRCGDGSQQRVELASRGEERLVAVAGEQYRFLPEHAPAGPAIRATALPEVIAPMPGRVLRVLVRPGDAVVAGDGLVVLEAMKMEHRLTAEAAGRVEQVRVTPGENVDAGAVLLLLSYAPTNRER